MRVARSIAIVILYMVCCDFAVAQPDGAQPANAKSEDQWVAEAMWSLVNLGSDMNDVFGACSLNGYNGRRDPCMIVIHSPKILELFQRKFRSIDLQCVQLLPPGDLLDQNTLNAVSESADLVMIPYSRIMTADGRVSPIASASGKKFIIAGTKAELLQAENVLRENACLVGSMESDLVKRIDHSNVP